MKLVFNSVREHLLIQIIITMTIKIKIQGFYMNVLHFLYLNKKLKSCNTVFISITVIIQIILIQVVNSLKT